MYLPRKDANFNTGTNNVINPIIAGIEMVLVGERKIATIPPIKARGKFNNISTAIFATLNS